MSHIIIVGSGNLEWSFRVLSRIAAATDSLLLRIVRRDSIELEDTVVAREALDDIRKQLASHELISVRVTDVEASTTAAVYSPRYQGDVLEAWTCIIEGSLALIDETYQNAKQETVHTFVVHAVDEIPDFEDAVVTTNNFPWSYWSVVRAAVRDDRGHWVERSGPATH